MAETEEHLLQLEVKYAVLEEVMRLLTVSLVIDTPDPAASLQAFQEMATAKFSNIPTATGAGAGKEEELRALALEWVARYMQSTSEMLQQAMASRRARGS